MGGDLSVAEKVEQALHRHKVTVVRLQDELDSLIKIFSHMREAFENEMMSGMGYKKLALTDNQVKQGAALSKMMTEMVTCKIRWDKAAKQMADSMTPEEEHEAVMKYIKTLSPEDQRRVVASIKAWQDLKYEREPRTSQPAE
jgi:hypothetical protein